MKNWNISKRLKEKSWDSLEKFLPAARKKYLLFSSKAWLSLWTFFEVFSKSYSKKTLDKRFTFHCRKTFSKRPRSILSLEAYPYTWISKTECFVEVLVLLNILGFWKVFCTLFKISVKIGTLLMQKRNE